MQPSEHLVSEDAGYPSSGRVENPKPQEYLGKPGDGEQQPGLQEPQDGAPGGPGGAGRGVAAPPGLLGPHALLLRARNLAVQCGKLRVGQSVYRGLPETGEGRGLE